MPPIAKNPIKNNTRNKLSEIFVSFDIPDKTPPTNLLDKSLLIILLIINVKFKFFLLLIL